MKSMTSIMSVRWVRELLVDDAIDLERGARFHGLYDALPVFVVESKNDVRAARLQREPGARRPDETWHVELVGWRRQRRVPPRVARFHVRGADDAAIGNRHERAA